MPDLNGLEAARRIRSASPNTEILILSMHYSDQLIRELLEAGVRGYIIKSDSDRDLIIAVETLANHKPFFTPRATEVILGNLNMGGPPTRAQVPATLRERLTSREREIVQLLAEGKSSKEVASSLCISVKTAETHRANTPGPALRPGRVSPPVFPATQFLSSPASSARGLVRQARRYYELIRLPAPVHPGVPAKAFPRRPARRPRGRAGTGPPGSRARRFRTCHGSPTAQGPPDKLARNAASGVAFRL